MQGGFVPNKHLSLRSVLVLPYLDDFVVVGYGEGCVREAAHSLKDALAAAGAIINIKRVLELVPELLWMGKLVIFSTPKRGSTSRVKVGRLLRVLG